MKFKLRSLFILTFVVAIICFVCCHLNFRILVSEFCTLSGTYQGTKKTGEVVQVEVWGGTDYGALVWIYWDEKLLFKHNFTFWTVKDAEIEGRRMLNGEWTKID